MLLLILHLVATRPRGDGRLSGGMQETPKRLADDLRRRGSLRSSTLQELAPQLGVKANRLDARRRRSQRRPSALGTPRDQQIDVVASFGLGSLGSRYPRR